MTMQGLYILIKRKFLNTDKGLEYIYMPSCEIRLKTYRNNKSRLCLQFKRMWKGLEWPINMYHSTTNNASPERHDF